jgi:hypothetical protein
MERVMDLDQAAVEIARRRPRWEAMRLAVGSVTWRDEAAAWPQTLEEDRERVADPDSIGVGITGPGEAELAVVLFRGGWADVDATTAGDIVTEAPDAGSSTAFGALLDDYVAWIFNL